MTTIAVEPNQKEKIEHTSAWKEKEQEIALARAYCLLIAVLHPGWAILLEIYLKDEFNDLLGRSLIGISFLLIGATSFFSKTMRRILPTVNYIGYSLFAVHWFWIVHRSGMSTIYVIGSLVVAFAFNLGFIRLRQLALYSAVLFTSALVTVLVTDAPFASKFMLVAGIATSQIVGMSFIYTRSTIAKNLEAAETKALKLQQELLDREVEAASIVQKNLLAPTPSIPELGLASYYRSAGKTGGDWYGHYFDKNQNKFSVWIGDVTGHGLPSALVTGVVCGAMYGGESRFDFHKMNADSEERLKGAADCVNRVVCERGGKLFMSMVLCTLDLGTGELLLVNAGHRMPLLLDGKEKPSQIQLKGDILGLAVEGTFPTKKVQLKRGDTVFLYTDGLVENEGPAKSTLSRNQLMRILGEVRDCHAAVAAAQSEAEKLWGQLPIDDDVSIVSFTWHPS